MRVYVVVYSFILKDVVWLVLFLLLVRKIKQLLKPNLMNGWKFSLPLAWNVLFLLIYGFNNELHCIPWSGYPVAYAQFASDLSIWHKITGIYFLVHCQGHVKFVNLSNMLCCTVISKEGLMHLSNWSSKQGFVIVPFKITHTIWQHIIIKYASL